MLQIHSGNLYKVLRDFHTLTGVRIELLDKNLNSLIYYPPEQIDFCKIVSSDTALKTKCAECDWHNSQTSAKTKNVVHYRCHLGLMEAVAPVYDDNEILGYVMFGQVLMKETCKQTRKILKEHFSESKYPGITDAIDSIPVKSAAELSASVTILETLATFFMSNQWIKPEKSEFTRRLDLYVESNLSQNITVDDICAEFRIKRTRLYSVAKEYLGCSLAKYIRQQKILHACRLLKETNMPVTAIAYATGFADYRHFSRIFRQIQNISATDYRKQNK
jgi:AraC-like DNA-binding protein